MLEVGHTLKCQQGNENNYFDYRDLEPISLTEEWLVKKLGFEKELSEAIGIDIWYSYDIDDFVVDEFEQGKFTYIKSSGKVEIKYVHQLQNLFYLLSNGKELTVKEGKGE